MKTTLLSAVFLLFGCFLVGCQKAEVAPGEPETMKAYYTAQPITIDGKLDEDVWKMATSYTFQGPKAWLEQDNMCTQSGRVMLAWDNQYVYIAGTFDDADIYAFGQEDGMAHFKSGDLLEVFLWPDDDTWYWEMYSTPIGKKTMYFFLGLGARMDHVPQNPIPQEMAVASVVTGTANQWKDRDQSWTTEMRIPFSELTQHGNAIPSEHWRILCARYNYDRMNNGIEYSSTPQLSKVNYHLIKEYGRLVFVKE